MGTPKVPGTWPDDLPGPTSQRCLEHLRDPEERVGYSPVAAIEKRRKEWTRVEGEKVACRRRTG